jgi:hypothetical protein
MWDDEDGEEGTINSKLTAQAQRKGVIMSHDAPEMLATTAMTQAEINKNNEKFWGNVAPGPEVLAGTRVAPIPVYHPEGGMGDEVAPTQSDPPDTRSDNLLERPHGGVPRTEDEAEDALSTGEFKHFVRTATAATEPSRKQGKAGAGKSAGNLGKAAASASRSGRAELAGEFGRAAAHEGRKALREDSVLSAARAGAEYGEKIANAHDDLEEGGEAMPVPRDSEAPAMSWMHNKTGPTNLSSEKAHGAGSLRKAAQEREAEHRGLTTHIPGERSSRAEKKAAEK